MKKSFKYIIIIIILLLYNCGGKYEPIVEPESVERKDSNVETYNRVEEEDKTDELEMVKIPERQVYEKKVNFYQRGIASWYGGKFHGRRTANGEVYDKYKLTAAHKTLPFNSIVEVTNLENNKKVLVRVNDRGPFVKNRIIDLSKKAAKMIGMEDSGTAKVSLKVLNDKSLNKIGASFSEYEENTDTFSKSEQLPQYEQWFYIQAGAFKDRGNAEKVLKKIQKVTDVVFSIKNNNGFYKVISVKLSPRSFAVKISSKLKEYYIDSFVKSF